VNKRIGALLVTLVLAALTVLALATTAWGATNVPS
jgi:hypothetical protein